MENGKGTQDEREKETDRVSQVLFYVSLHLQDQCKEVTNEAEDAKFRQPSSSLAYIGISAVSLSPGPREDFLKTSWRKLPTQKRKGHVDFPFRIF